MKIIHKTFALGALILSSTAYAGGGHEHHGHDEHGADKTVINNAAAKEAGIKLQTASAGIVSETAELTGRITLNRDTTVHVRGRFAGIVKSVHVKWGDKVKKGQLLARVESNESLNVYNITSPIDGVVLERNTSTGDIAGESALFQIADLSNVWAEFHVFPKDLGRVYEGLSMDVNIVGSHKQASAKVDLMLPTADKLSQTVIAVAVLENSDGTWRPGMTVSGKVYTAEKQAAVVVEPAALQMLEGRQVVFVQHDGAYEARTVETGLSGPLGIEILDGVSAGESYVAEGSFIVKADIGKNSAEHVH